MDNDTQVKEFAASTLPRAVPFQASSSPSSPVSAMNTPTSSAVASVDAQDQTGVFSNLVKGDGDIAGLVAYSIYKQNKLDWLRAFQTSRGRTPNDAELTSYIIGEGTPRRLATYRHLAEATLAGHGPNIGNGYDGPTSPRTRSSLARQNLFSPGLMAIYGLIALLFVLGFWLALHFTMSTR